nr:hypothetical protein [uncultured Oscillibacter sp.]
MARKKPPDYQPKRWEKKRLRLEKHLKTMGGVSASEHNLLCIIRDGQRSVFQWENPYAQRRGGAAGPAVPGRAGGPGPLGGVPGAGALPELPAGDFKPGRSGAERRPGGPIQERRKHLSPTFIDICGAACVKIGARYGLRCRLEVIEFPRMFLEAEDRPMSLPPFYDEFTALLRERAEDRRET